MKLPNEITHYYSRADRPFQNLSTLGEEDLIQVLERLKSRRQEDPNYKRVFGPRYMALRRLTEDKLRRLFVNRGGKPETLSPHYFVLGECPWFAALYPDTEKVTLDWRTLPRDVTSFTYPDSFVAMRLGHAYGLPVTPRQPFHERVYFGEELPDLIAEFGLPDGSVEDSIEGYHSRPFDKYIEVQLWSDKPIEGYLKGACPQDVGCQI